MVEKKEKGHGFFQNHDDDEEINLIKKKNRKKKPSRIPRWIYRIALILFLTVLALTWWFNRDKLTAENISDWLQTRFVGMGVGDGYPVSVPGGETKEGNFLSVDGEAVLVSNTALTAWNSTGKQTMSVQHSSSQPAVREAAGRYLTYSIGGTGYQIDTHSRNLLKKNTKQKILAGAVSSGGRFALATQAEDYASHLTVFFQDGSVQYEYDFGQAYVTSAALNTNGTRGAVSGILSKDGAMTSVVYVFDFNREKPLYTIYSSDNMIFDIQWGDDGVLSAVGDRSALWIDTDGGKFEEYPYNGQKLTAYETAGSRVLLSLSGYSVSGACTVLEFRGNARPVTRIASSSPVKSVSIYGETLAVLAGNQVQAYSSGTGEKSGSCDAGGDARKIALQNESSVYLLGVSEVRQSNLS